MGITASIPEAGIAGYAESSPGLYTCPTKREESKLAQWKKECFHLLHFSCNEQS